MGNHKNELPSMPNPGEIITVLLVSSHPEDHRFLRQTFAHPNWKLYRALDRRQAEPMLLAAQIPVVLCERSLPDGTWRDVFGIAESLHQPPMFVVVSEAADQYLWAEVLNLGGYDVLAKPFDRGELLRVIGMSWRHWKRRQDEVRIGPEREASAGLASPLAS